MKEVYEKQAKERQGKRNDIVEKLPQCKPGKARDQAGTAVKVSGKTIDHAVEVRKQCEIEAKKRQKEGGQQGGKKAGKGRPIASGSKEPQAKSTPDSCYGGRDSENAARARTPRERERRESEGGLCGAGERPAKAITRAGEKR